MPINYLEPKTSNAEIYLTHLTLYRQLHQIDLNQPLDCIDEKIIQNNILYSEKKKKKFLKKIQNQLNYFYTKHKK